MKLSYLAGLACCAAACQPLPLSEPAPPDQQDEGLAFVQASCGGCHATDRYSYSPNPLAPPFAVIVNQPGLTTETLSTWLKDAHNYPEEMEFSLEQDEVDDLVTHMLRLRHPNYRPPI